MSRTSTDAIGSHWCSRRANGNHKDHATAVATHEESNKTGSYYSRESGKMHPGPNHCNQRASSDAINDRKDNTTGNNCIHPLWTTKCKVLWAPIAQWYWGSDAKVRLHIPLGPSEEAKCPYNYPLTFAPKNLTRVCQYFCISERPYFMFG